ncbi:lysophospholipid acyltransferase family protein [Rhodobacteraceae bacterium]|nr:lysophospholipid acyltransferase family protein [Paracoccaceae bacterium]
MDEGNVGRRDLVQNVLARSVLKIALLMPYRLRLAFMGKVIAYVVAPYAGWNRRTADNLSLVMPDLSKPERRRIIRQVSDNVGRTLVEIYSGEDFIDRARSSRLEGPGIAALEAARAAGRPIILATAHLGNYDAVRGKLSREGYSIGALYRPMQNEKFNRHYVEAISNVASPVFPASARGFTGLMRHLKGGGVVGIVMDVAKTKTPVLTFFGAPAHTPLSAAEWALKYDAVLIPVFGIRQDDGLSFKIQVEEPLEHSTPEAMMQAYNDVVEAVVRRHPEQWFWIHRRWKLSPGAREKLSATAPLQA